MTFYNDQQMAKAERSAQALARIFGPNPPWGAIGPEGVVARLRSPWAWLLPIGLGVAAFRGKKKHRPGLALAAAATLLVVNGVRPPGASRFP